MRRAEWGLGRETPDFVCCDPREVVKCRFAVPGDPHEIFQNKLLTNFQ